LCAEIVATWAFSLRVPTSRDSLRGAIQPALQVDRAGAGNDIAHAVSKHRLRQDGRRACTIADGVAGFFRGLAQHLRAEIFLGILEVEFLCDSHTVIANNGRSPALLDQHRLRFWAQCDAHRVAELCSAAQDLLAGG
jgi:hypothetical protein